MTLHKILKYLALVIGVLGLVLWGRIIFAGDEAIEASGAMQSSLLSPMMWVAYIVLFIVILSVLVFVIKGLFSGNIKNTLISAGAFIAIVLIAYFTTSGTETTLKDGSTLPASAEHWVGAGLVTFYILAIFAIGAMVFSGIKKLTK